MISVVIPCYNAAATVAATIESALAQDVPLEVVVVDDGSADASLDVLRTFGDRIRWVSTPNRGVSAARTLGIEMASGDFVQYLDSDDLLVPGTLAARLSALESSGADIAHTDWQKLLQQPDGHYAPGPIMTPDLDLIAQDAQSAAATSSFWAPPAALLYRRSVVDRIGAWSPRLPVIQDARYLFDAAACGARFVHVPGVGALYRVTAGSLSRRNVQRFIADCATNTAEIEQIWMQRGELTPVRRQALASMWGHVATASAMRGFEEFEVARPAYNRHARRRALFELAHGLRALVGPSFGAAVLNAGLWIKSRGVVQASRGGGGTEPPTCKKAN